MTPDLNIFAKITEQTYAQKGYKNYVINIENIIFSNIFGKCLCFADTNARTNECTMC